MDAERLDPRELAVSLDHLAAVNRWLGGTRAVLRALDRMLPRGGTVLDAGTGSGDIPRALVRRARRNRQTVAVFGLDRHPQTAAIAAARCAAEPAIRIGRGDVRALPFADDAVDVAIFSLTLHHLDDDDQIAALRELDRVARRGIIINELERSWPNYVGARILASTIWRSDPVTRHDGPLSVLRGFSPDELLERARSAGLPQSRIERVPFYRLVLTAGETVSRGDAPATVRS